MKKPVKKLTVKAGKRNLKKGKKLKLKVKAKPGKKLASTQYCWKSSNKKIAAVSAKGVVKAKKKVLWRLQFMQPMAVAKEERKDQGKIGISRN